MNNKIVTAFKAIYLNIIILAVAICTLFFTKAVFAEQYQLKLIVDLSELNDVSTDAVWLDPLISPTNGGFFVAQNNGIIYLTDKDDTINQKTVLNLPQMTNSPAFISLNAMTLHPSFTIPEHPGYATLYTSHTTEFGQQNNNNRLTLNDDKSINFTFETVITAWQYDFDEQKIDTLTQREILRIPIKNQNAAIQQLAFDPYEKSWNTDYGQLYFSLKYEDELRETPLYSGVILRIYPLMFGTRNYTVPETNPYVEDPEINDEIVVMNGQNIEHFFWAKNNHGKIFVQHNNSEQYWLSSTKVGGNLLTQPQSNFLWQRSTSMLSMMLYQGRNFLNLRTKMISFTQIDNQWRLASLPLVPLINELPIFEELIAKETLSTTSHLNIHQDDQGEIILFDKHKSKMYSLQPTNSKGIAASAPQSNTTLDGSKNYVVYPSLFAGLLLLLIFFYRKKIHHKGSISLFNRDLVRFEYQPTTQTIFLFRANQKKAHKTLTLDGIIRCEVLIDNDVINIIDNQPQNVISNQNEEEMRTRFIIEYCKKMVSKQTRNIEIILSDKDDNYTVCLYLRKGNNRVTGTKYYEVIDIIIDLCWVISKRINPRLTETRLIPAVVKMAVSAQRAAGRQPKKHDKVEYSDESKAKPEVAVTKSEKTLKHDIPKGGSPMDQTAHEVKVVDALEKLARLHQQGHLTPEEFKLAKTKLLQNRLDN
jgi:hypothetical protein